MANNAEVKSVKYVTHPTPSFRATETSIVAHIKNNKKELNIVVVLSLMVLSTQMTFY